MVSLNVKLWKGIMGLVPGVESDACLFLKASNPGHKTVVVTVSSFLLPDGRDMVFPYPQSSVTFPFKLEPEQQCMIWIDLKKIGNLLRSEGFSGTVRLLGYYQDAVGRRHKSKPYKLDVDVWG